MPSKSDGYGFTPAMEMAAVRQILVDPSALGKVHRNLRAEGFEDPRAQLILRKALKLFGATGQSPTKVQVFQEVKDEVESGSLIEQRALDAEAWAAGMATLTATVPTPYVVEKILGRERERALFRAIEDAGELHLKGAYDQILPTVEKADAIGKHEGGKGIDLVKDMESRTRHRLLYKTPQKHGTGIGPLDDLMGGGLSHDNPLGLVLGGLKSGKSLFLDAVSIHSMSCGLNVAYFSYENGENEVTLRHDAAIADIRIDEVWGRAEDVSDRVLKWARACGGSIWIRKMVPQTSVRDSEAELDARRLDDGWEPNLIIWDYTKLLASNDPKKYDRRHEELGGITLEMKECLERRQCIGWSAAQVKNAALEKETLVVGDIGYSTEMAENVDVVVAICRTAEERNDELVRFGVAASRFSIDALSTSPIASKYSKGRIVENLNGVQRW